jgi:DNA-binding transcriptional MocR family regulator
LHAIVSLTHILIICCEYYFYFLVQFVICGGMMVHVCATPQLPGEEVFKVLASHGVIVVPGDDFKVPGVEASPGSSDEDNSDREGEVVLRLSYAASSPEMIEAGIARLVVGIKDALE